MDIVDKVTATDVLKTLIKTLCLEEFPCGSGSWRNSKNKNVEDFYSTTTKKYNLNHEKIEILKEFLHSGTWDVNTNWSGEVSSLRNLAVSKPFLINEKLIYSYFKTLRLISKQITEVDEDILKLKNLEEFTLSVNRLTSIPASLPPKIKILELSTNKIEDLSTLKKKTLQLLHLGLSYNLLSGNTNYKYFTVDQFPNLMSLDLSYNNLTDLVSLVEKLTLLPKLKNLTLVGNPLSLIPGYKGFVIDSLRELLIFDDHHITADEKHHFKGLARRKENILDEAHLSIFISNLKGIPMPNEANVEENPEFPVVIRSYFVQYELPPTYNQNASIENIEYQLPVISFSSDKCAWEEPDINFEYHKFHCIDDLPLLKNIFTKGIKFSIIEEKIEFWPPPEKIDQTPEIQKKKDKNVKETPPKKGKETPKGKADKDKGKKKPKQSTTDNLISKPPKYETIAEYTAPLAIFLDRSNTFECNCHCGGGPLPEVTIVESNENLGKTIGVKKRQDQNKIRKASAGTKTKMDETQSEDNELPKPILPITLKIKITLKRWETAADSLKQPC